MGDIIKNRIRRFWSGDLSKKEAQDLLKALDQPSPAVQERIRREMNDAAEGEEALCPEQSAALLEAIREKAGLPIVHKEIYSYSWLTAAVALLICTVGALLYQVQKQDTMAVVSVPLETRQQVPNNIRIATQQDSMRYVLPDGSSVLLSPHAVLCYDKGYGISNRVIELQGEGKFAVEHDTSLPFVVCANGFTTTALGTEFIVDGRDLIHTKVHLLSGKVVVRSTHSAGMAIQDTYLEVGEMLAIDEINKVWKKEGIAPKDRLLTPKKRPIADQGPEPKAQQALRFVKTDLTEVMKELSANFQTTILLDPTVASNLTFTGEFAASDSLEDILNTICLLNDLAYGRRENGSLLIRAPQKLSQQEKPGDIEQHLKIKIQ